MLAGSTASECCAMAVRAAVEALRGSQARQLQSRDVAIIMEVLKEEIHKEAQAAEVGGAASTTTGTVVHEPPQPQVPVQPHAAGEPTSAAYDTDDAE